MPLLKYRCAACGKIFEELVSGKSAGLVRCPECGGSVSRAYEGKCSPVKLKSEPDRCANCPHCQH